MKFMPHVHPPPYVTSVNIEIFYSYDNGCINYN